jgi:hypothetical protein
MGVFGRAYKAVAPGSLVGTQPIGSQPPEPPPTRHLSRAVELPLALRVTPAGVA